MADFQLSTEFKPQGDQPNAIGELTEGLRQGLKHQTLLGVTGSGKTFTIANVIAQVNRPTLIMAPNKTLAAQLYSEFKELFPHNAVEYFVSYYDYYQPEAYVPSKDLYIEKDSAINETIDQLRHAATRSLLERRDVIIVSSVSCIYGLGSPESYHGMVVPFKVGEERPRSHLLKEFIKVQYERNDYDFHRGAFRVRGDVVEIFPAHEEMKAIRIEYFGDEIERISEIDPIRGSVLQQLKEYTIYPASHFVTPEEQTKRALETIKQELKDQLHYFEIHGKLLEAQRLEQRTRFDLEMMEEIGFCKGIENYSRHLTGRGPGQPPPTLIDYFPPDFLLVLDESHMMIPQINGMYHGDQNRKQNLVDYGFRLPSARDNRPLKFEEFESLVHQAIYVSATPAEYELEHSHGVFVEQIIRPTGLMDPTPIIHPVAHQVDHLEKEIHKRIAKGERILVTTLTKKMSEDLTKYYKEKGIKVRYLHSEIETLERMEILRQLRLGEFDVLVGINLLREGLDLPEVSLVAILDADKEGFLRSERSLIQTFGRAARNVNGEVILYADRQTDSMKKAISETIRRRTLQEKYNTEHGITPTTIKKTIGNSLFIENKDYVDLAAAFAQEKLALSPKDIKNIPKNIEGLKKQMKEAASKLDFEKAAELRDQIKKLKEIEISLGIS